MKPQIKTIDIQAKEWFDKVNGNSYFASVMTINHLKDSEMIFKIPMQYGYGEQYIYECLNLLKSFDLIDAVSKMMLIDKGIKINASIKKNCKKSDLKNI